jgi:hypothetical protein
MLQLDWGPKHVRRVCRSQYRRLTISITPKAEYLHNISSSTSWPSPRCTPVPFTTPAANPTVEVEIVTETG